MDGFVRCGNVWRGGELSWSFASDRVRWNGWGMIHFMRLDVARHSVGEFGRGLRGGGLLVGDAGSRLWKVELREAVR